jgi:hypothetical protein
MGDLRRVARAQIRPVVVTSPAEIDISNADNVGEQLCAAFCPRRQDSHRRHDGHQVL